MWVEDACIFGEKGRGKTTLLLCRAAIHQGGVLIHDVNGDMPCPGWALEADASSSLRAVRSALSSGHKVVFRAASATDERVRAELLALCELCKRTEASLWCDEAHIGFAKARTPAALLDYVRRSRHHGGDFTLATTNPQAVDNAGMYVGATLFLGRCPGIEPWLSTYGIDAAAVSAALAGAGPHAFVPVRTGSVGEPVEPDVTLLR